MIMRMGAAMGGLAAAASAAQATDDALVTADSFAASVVDEALDWGGCKHNTELKSKQSK